MSDAYDFRPGGSLKLKGVKDGGVVKKKKKSKSSSSKSELEKERERTKELLLREEESTQSPGSGRNSPAIQGKDINKTEAEKRFEEVKRRRLAERVSKLAHKSHKERVSEFNAHLESLSEHHDIPKVGPG